MDFYKKNNAPYEEIFNHIADICNLMRFCFESDNLEEVIKAFNYLRM